MRASRLLFRAMSTAREATAKQRHEKLIAVETEIYSPCINNDIYYRGFPLRELVNKCTFTDVAHLLIKGSLPQEHERATFDSAVNEGMNNVTPLVHKVRQLMPQNAHVANILTASLSCLDAGYDHGDACSYEKIIGECLAILARSHDGSAMKLQSEDTVLDFLAQTVCSVPINKLDLDTKRLLNTIAILYMEHGLTSASYAARICISEEGSVYSALINAIATHKSCTPMFAWQHFDELFNACETEKRNIIKTYNEELRLPKPFRDFVHPCKDPRTDILMEHCDAGMLDQVLEIQKCLDGRCHLRFDVFVFHLLRRLHKDQNQSTIGAFRSMLMMPRIVGWLSHIAEQHKVKRRIEHIAAYVGPAPKQITRKSNA